MAASIAICVDDFGLHGGVDAAVLHLAQRGRISATSCMVGGPSWTEGAAALRDLAPQGLDLGLHLDLTGHPLDPALHGGLGRWMLSTSLRRVDALRLRAEVEAQLDRFEAALGRTPDHVDGHQHVHQFPVVRELLVEVLARRYPRRMPWLRRTHRVAGMPFGFKAAVIDAMGCAGLSRLARRLGLAQNRRMVGVYDFQGGPGRFEALAQRWLAGCADGDLLMCHPAQQGQGAAGDPLLPARLAEFSLLDSPRWEEMMAQAGVRLVRMGDWLRSAPARS